MNLNCIYIRVRVSTNNWIQNETYWPKLTEAENSIDEIDTYIHTATDILVQSVDGVKAT
jgi:hypothetical protein